MKTLELNLHNINCKQVPLPMEHNITLIMEDEDLFPDELIRPSDST